MAAEREKPNLVSSYLIIQSTDRSKTLIARKQITNAFRHGKISDRGEVMVNQAGQWAAPGGRMEGKDPVASAFKEFKEECGIKLNDYGEIANVQCNTLTDGEYSYCLVSCTMDERILLGHVAPQINNNLRPTFN